MTKPSRMPFTKYKGGTIPKRRKGKRPSTKKGKTRSPEFIKKIREL